MKMLLSACAVLIAGVAVAEELKTLSAEDLEFLKRPYTSLTDAEKAKRKELSKLKVLIRDGGEMVRPGTPVGRILVVNKQKRVPAEALAQFKESFAMAMEYDIQFSDKDGDAGVVIELADVPGAKSLAVYPDERRVVVDVGALAFDNPKPAFLAARTRKEMLRGFACVTAGSTYGSPLFGSIKGVKTLDDIGGEGFPLDVVMRATSYLDAAGMKPIERDTYRGLLHQGFDIAPTNGYQKAIYDAEKANPHPRKKRAKK